MKPAYFICEIKKNREKIGEVLISYKNKRQFHRELTGVLRKYFKTPQVLFKRLHAEMLGSWMEITSPDSDIRIDGYYLDYFRRPIR